MPYAYIPQRRFTEPPPFEPSPWLLQMMIDAAMEKADRSIAESKRARAADVAEAAFAHNARVIGDARAHDMRRHMYVGDAA